VASEASRVRVLPPRPRKPISPTAGAGPTCAPPPPPSSNPSPPHTLHAGEKILVDDGSCPPGQIKEIIGGTNMSYKNGAPQPGTPRQEFCVPPTP
jgi:Family of unknown function (DUF6719)